MKRKLISTHLPQSQNTWGVPAMFSTPHIPDRAVALIADKKGEEFVSILFLGIARVKVCSTREKPDRD